MAGQGCGLHSEDGITYGRLDSREVLHVAVQRMQRTVESLSNTTMMSVDHIESVKCIIAGND